MVCRNVFHGVFGSDLTPAAQLVVRDSRKSPLTHTALPGSRILCQCICVCVCLCNGRVRWQSCANNSERCDSVSFFSLFLLSSPPLVWSTLSSTLLAISLASFHLSLSFQVFFSFSLYSLFSFLPSLCSVLHQSLDTVLSSALFLSFPSFP